MSNLQHHQWNYCLSLPRNSQSESLRAGKKQKFLITGICPASNQYGWILKHLETLKPLRTKRTQKTRQFLKVKTDKTKRTTFVHAWTTKSFESLQPTRLLQSHSNESSQRWIHQVARNQICLGYGENCRPSKFYLKVNYFQSLFFVELGVLKLQL